MEKTNIAELATTLQKYKPKELPVTTNTVLYQTATERVYRNCSPETSRFSVDSLLLE